LTWHKSFVFLVDTLSSSRVMPSVNREPNPIKAKRVEISINPGLDLARLSQESSTGAR
jgi:hypothetical protein